MQTKKTYCRICEAACGLVAEFDENGRLHRLRPDKAHPVSKGYVCAKGTRFAEVAHHSQRLRKPQQRAVDGAWIDVAWEQALPEIGVKLNEIIAKHGPHAVAVYYGNPTLFNALGLVSVLAFNRALATRNIYSSFSVDCNNKFAASKMMHGGELILPIPDLEHADLAVMMGTNPAVSQGSFVHLDGGGSAFDHFTTRGGEVIWIDPRRTESAKRWGEHLPIRPGTDVYLLLALIDELRGLYRPDKRVAQLDVLFDLAAQYPAEQTAVLTQIPAETIRNLAQRIRETKNVTFHMSVGVNMGPFGTLAFIAQQALAYLTGNLDRKGGLLFHPLGRLLSTLIAKTGIGVNPEESRIGRFTGIFDELPAAILADEILTEGDGQIRALILIGGNPIASVPGEAKLRQAFANLDLMVQIDLFANESSEYAHYLLPTTSWLERWDVATTSAALQTASMLQYSGPVLSPFGDVRAERQILATLALELKRPFLGWRWFTKLLGASWLDGGLNKTLNLLTWPYRLFKNGAYGLPSLTPKAGKYLGKGPRTKSKQVQFWHAKLRDEPARLAEFAEALTQETAVLADGQIPLTLISRRRRLGHNSWLHSAQHDGKSEAVAWMSPADLNQLNCQEIRIANAEGVIQLAVKPKEEVSQGTIVVPHGLPTLNINTLFPSGMDEVERVSGNHQMTGIPVVVSRV